MRMLLLAAAATLALAGCSTTSMNAGAPSTSPTPKADAAIQKNLPKICQAASTAHFGYVTLTMFVSVPEKADKAVSSAWDVLQPLCIDPAKTTATDVLAAAERAYATIEKALEQAKKA
jgi:hypothetical protein